MEFILDGRMLYRDRAGIGRYIWELQRALAELGAPPGGRTTILMDARDGRAQSASLPVRRAATPARHALEPLTMRAELRGARVAHFPDHGVPPGVRVPAVATVHDVSFLTRPDTHHPTSRAFYTKAVKTLLRAERVIAVSEWGRREIVARGLADPARVTVVPEAPATTLDAPHDSGPDDAPPPYGLIVGTIQPRKNLPRVAEAFLHTRASRDSRLLVVGAIGYRGTEIVRAVRAIDPNRRIRFIGQASDALLAGLLRRASFVLLASLEEGFGLPALEAMNAGVPCVVSDSGALPEVTAGAALTVDPGDVDSITAAVDRLVDDRGLQETLVQRGRARAADFSWARAAASTAEIYAQIA